MFGGVNLWPFCSSSVLPASLARGRAGPCLGLAPMVGAAGARGRDESTVWCFLGHLSGLPALSITTRQQCHSDARSTKSTFFSCTSGALLKVGISKPFSRFTDFHSIGIARVQITPRHATPTRNSEQDEILVIKSVSRPCYYPTNSKFL